MEVIVQDANNIVIEVDQGRQGRGVEDVSLITVGADYYLLFTFTDGTTEQVGPIATTVTEVISAEVRNAEAVTILKGQPVYLYQAQGNLATVKLAYNTSDATSAKTLGLAAENIAPNAQGLITCQGTLGGLNTSAYNEGDTLYLGATAGTLTNVKPQAPNHLVYIGVVERANAGAGQIYVRVQNGFELDEIHDVRIVSPVNGNTLIYDASTSLWKNAGITAGSGISVTNGAASITVGNTGVLSFSGGTTGLTPATATTGAVSLAGTLAIANGGTGQTTANAALNALLPAQTSQSGKYLKTDGSNAAWDQLDISTADITGTLPIANGGTGQSTANAGLNALLPSQISQSGKYLKTDGTNASWDQLDISTADITGTLPVANGGTGVTTSTGTGSVVLSNSPALTTPNLGTPSAVTLTNATGLPLSTGVTGTLATTNGGTGLTSFTSGGVVYASSSSALTTGSALTFDGTNFTLGTPTPSGGFRFTQLVPTSASPINAFRVTNGSDATFDALLQTNLTTIGAGVGALAFIQNNSEGMRLTSTGLGIGNSSPTEKLDVTGNFKLSGTATLSGGTANGVLYLNGSKVATSGSALTFDGASQITLNGSTTSSALSIKSTVSETSLQNINNDGYLNMTGTGGLIFRLGAGYTEGMRLNGTGLGIGTSSPGAKLDVVGSTNGIFAGRVFNTNSGSSAYSILYLGNNTDGNLGALLATSSTNTAYGGVNSLNLYTGGAYPIGFVTNNTLRMLLDSSGNLGIGTSSPTDTNGFGRVVDIQSNSGGQVVIRDSDDTTKFARLAFDGGTTNVAYVGAEGSGTSVLFRAGGATCATLDSSGNLGLGVTPSAWGSGWTASQVRTSHFANISNNYTSIGYNAYESSGWKYIGNNYALLYQQNSTAGAHSWAIAPSGTAGNTISFTQAMTLDASGRLLVNTTVANITNSERLTVNGIATIYTGSATVPTLYVQNTDSTASTNQPYIGLHDGVSIRGALGVNYTDSATIINGQGGIRFRYGGTGIGTTEAARITSGGDFGIGNTNPQYRLTVDKDTTSALAFFANSNASAPNGLYVDFSAASPNNTTEYFLYCEDSTAQRATIRSNGGLANYSANDVNLSDRREKTNFAPAKSYLDTICAIPVQTFEYIDQSPDDPGLTLGVVAQDVQAVAPELVMESNWGTEDEPKMRLSIYQTDLQYALMKCIQELKAELDAVKTELATLKGN